jgi:trans-2,3-dihydro-3-hydroxyanthranilate isomerase
MPMAGHPTIGSTFALAHLGVIEAGRDVFTFELPVGPTPVQLEWDAQRLSFAWMTQQRPKYGPVGRDAGELAAALRIDPDQVADLPIEEVSCGVPFFFLPLKTRKAVDQAESDRTAMNRFFEAQKLPSHPVFLFSIEPGADEATAYSRMFAPDLGISEDPATGAASGPLGCYLVKHGLLAADQAAHFVSLQGVKMSRPSRVHISIEQAGGHITRVRVGGKAVLIGEGTLRSR